MPNHEILFDALIVLFAAIMMVPLFRRLKLSPILGYLAAGMLLGPHGVGVVTELEEVQLLAEFGVLFLLFMIGLELPLDRLKALRKYVFGLGGAQVLVTTGVIAAICAAVFDLGVEASILIGASLALSSTATVLQLLAERGELIQRHGRVSLAILLMQDLAVAPLLALIPIMALQGEGLAETLGWSLVKAIAAFVSITVIARYVLRPFYRAVVAAGSPELFTATALFIVLGTSLLTEQAGLSMALGAFLAGMLLAETEFRHQVESDILPFRGLFLGLFFMTVGMSVDGSLIIRELALVGALLVGLLALKTLLITGLCLAFGLSGANSVRTGFSLAQGGEFAFVLLGLAVSQGLADRYAAQLAFIVVALSIVATPALVAMGRQIAQRLEKRRTNQPATLQSEADDLSDHVVIAGFGRVGQQVSAILVERNIPFIALEKDAQAVQVARRHGLPVFFGDASRADILEAARLSEARACVLTMHKDSGEAALISILRSRHPKLPIFVRAHDWDHSADLDEAGSTAVVEETAEMSLRLSALVLRSYGVTLDEVRALNESLREEDYAGLKALVSARVKDAGQG